MKRRVVSQIVNYPHPKVIYRLITRKSWPYNNIDPTLSRLVSRDRCFMALSFLSGGRTTALLGGPRFIVENSCLECNGDVERVEVKDHKEWICSQCGKKYGKRKPKILGSLKTDGKHAGLRKKNFTIKDKLITVSDMGVIKRKRDTIEKRGVGITIRDDFLLPLVTGLYNDEAWDQLVPFSWLVNEYLTVHMKKAKPNSSKGIYLKSASISCTMGPAVKLDTVNL